MIFEKCGTYYLATVEGEQPRVRPFGTVDLSEGKLYLQTGSSANLSPSSRRRTRRSSSAPLMESAGSGSRRRRYMMTTSRPRSICWLPTPACRRYQPGDGNTAVYYPPGRDSDVLLLHGGA